MILAATLLIASQTLPLPSGPSKISLTLEGTTLETYVYKPHSYRGRRMICVLHGTLRNADEYRDHAIRMAERLGALVVAPKFDAERFPNRLYHRGGVLNEDGTAARRSTWTYRFIPALAREVRRIEGRPRLPYVLIGHSAGAQFLVRYAGLFDPPPGDGPERIVAANPGSDLFPTRAMPFGYGFGNLPPELASDAIIRAYLGRPLTLYLGTADDHADEDLDVSPEAMAQGLGRYQRGRAAYAFAQRVAREQRVPFRWRVVEA
ncbi:MAG: hypothetical protein C4320_03155, partial [Armatimonadota bacterium]